MYDVDTIAAVATSAGIGGIGIIRVSGPRVPEIMSAVAGKHLPPRVATFVRFRDVDGSLLDEGLALYFPAPHSYTGDDVLELHGHGGPVVLNGILRRCLETGARPANAGEFTKRAFLNGKIDLTQAEAVADLISASSERAAKSAAQSLTGEFSRRVHLVQEELTSIRVVLEGSLDFPDEGIDFIAGANVAARLEALEATLGGALQAAAAGQLLSNGIRVALIGPPNVGKSSIINNLSGEEVAIVAPDPGTTRDLVRSSILIQGIPIHIVDTAGIRDASESVEQAGIRKTWEAIHAAQLLVCVTEASAEHGVLATRLPTDARVLHVHNKIDLLGIYPRVEREGAEAHVWISARHGHGIDLLRDEIVRYFAPADALDGSFSARTRHLTSIEQARASVRRARNHLPDADLSAEELRLAQQALGQVTGEVAPDDLLGEIFSHFCIGK